MWVMRFGCCYWQRREKGLIDLQERKEKKSRKGGRKKESTGEGDW